MRLLFVKLKHIGDTLILTPTLAAVRHACPHAHITVIVRSGCDGILAGCPAIDTLHSAAPPERKHRRLTTSWSDVRLALRLRADRFDFAFELGGGDRGRFLVVAADAQCRATHDGRHLPRIWHPWFDHRSDLPRAGLHQVEMDYRLVRECLPLPPTPPPLQFVPSAADPTYLESEQLTRPIVVHPATRWRRKQWPMDAWAVLLRRLASHPHSIVLSCGPVPEEIAFCRELQACAAVPMRLTEGRLTWAQMAGLLRAAVLFVGVDTAAMHLAAACQTPSVVLFGPSWEVHWRPWQAPHTLITPPISIPAEGLDARMAQARERRMVDILPDQVYAACERILKGIHTSRDAAATSLNG